MKHGFFKVIAMLVIISLFMALTGFTSKHKITLALLTAQMGDLGRTNEALVFVESEVKGAGRTEIYLNAINALREGKVQNFSNLTTAFSDNYTIINIAEEDGLVIVDFSSRNLKGSAAEEKLLVSQIVATLLGSFPEIEAVQFFVDGESGQTLMGQVDITTPFRTPVDFDIAE